MKTPESGFELSGYNAFLIVNEIRTLVRAVAWPTDLEQATKIEEMLLLKEETQIPPPRDLVLHYVDTAAQVFEMMNKADKPSQHTELDKKMRELYEKLRSANDDTPYKDVLKDIRKLTRAFLDFRQQAQEPLRKMS